MATTPETQTMPDQSSKSYLKVALAWIISLAILFTIVYFISRGWKAGQKAA